MDLSKLGQKFMAGDEIDLAGGSIQAEVLQKLCVSPWRDGKNFPLLIRNGTIEGDLTFDDLECNAAIRLRELKLGKLHLEHAKFDMLVLKECEAAGIEAAGLATTGPIDLHAKFGGRVRLVAATIGADLNCTAAKLGRTEHQREQNWSALIFDNARVEGSIWLKEIEADGPVRGWRVRIGKALLCSGSKVNGDLVLRDADISQNGDLDEARIDGNVDLRGARLGAGLTLKKGARFAEGVLLGGAAVGGDLTLDNIEVGKPGADLTRTHITGTLGAQKVVAAGDEAVEITLNGTSASTLSVGRGSWPERPEDSHYVDGISVTRLTDPDPVWLTEWLQKNKIWTPQPWQEVSAALRRDGHEKDARDLAIARERKRTSQMPRLAKPWREVLHWTIGYGYRPGNAVGVSAVVVVIWWLLYQFVDFEKEGEPESGTFLYSLDTFMPIDLGYFTSWTPVSTGGSLLAAIEAGLGWLLAALLLGAATGLLRKD